MGGTFSPDDGNASPLLAVHAFYTAARRAGRGVPLQRARRPAIITGGRPRPRRPHGQGRATPPPVVVNAAGAVGAPRSAALAGLDVPVRPDSPRGGGDRSRRAASSSPWSSTSGRSPGSANYYFYQHDTGQIVFCITPEPQHLGHGHARDELVPADGRRAAWSDLMPRLRNLRVRRTWRGLYPMTPDGFPIVGWTRELEGYMLAVGMCGQGFMLGPGLGELIARMVVGRETEDDRETLSYLSPYREFKGQEKLK
ncbi:MAG: FAD-binding oxidoreductase [Candidatus Moduliflexus flocculans]|nr:FAD-binding oxidoreductase [Candidatus Moduliflexus flocculans]